MDSIVTVIELVFYLIITIGKDSIAAFKMIAAGKEKKETVLLLHGIPGNEKHFDFAQ